MNLKFRKTHYLPAFMLKIQGFLYKILGKASAMSRVERMANKCRACILAACLKTSDDIYMGYSWALQAENLKKSSADPEESKQNRARNKILAQEAERCSLLAVKQSVDKIQLFGEEMMCKAAVAANAFAEGYNYRAKPESKLSLEKVDFGTSAIDMYLKLLLDFSYLPQFISTDKKKEK